MRCLIRDGVATAMTKRMQASSRAPRLPQRLTEQSGQFLRCFEAAPRTGKPANNKALPLATPVWIFGLFECTRIADCDRQHCQHNCPNRPVIWHGGSPYLSVRLAWPWTAGPDDLSTKYAKVYQRNSG